MVAQMVFCTIVVNDNGNRDVPYGDQHGERWDAYWYWLGRSFSRGGRLAVSGE